MAVQLHEYYNQHFSRIKILTVENVHILASNNLKMYIFNVTQKKGKLNIAPN